MLDAFSVFCTWDGASICNWGDIVILNGPVGGSKLDKPCACFGSEPWSIWSIEGYRSYDVLPMARQPLTTFIVIWIARTVHIRPIGPPQGYRGRVDNHTRSLVLGIDNVIL